MSRPTPSRPTTLRLAREVITTEADALHAIAERLGPSFHEAVGIILAAKGRVILTGIGKSALIAQKIVSTFNSMGTRAIFMHAADAVHGDLGMVSGGDVLMVLSNSGETAEFKVFLPLLKGKVPIIAVVGRADSYVGRQADCVIEARIEKEACPNGLAPTTSTTVQLAIGDALAVVLAHYRQFTPEDFARVHPGGMLGKRLLMKVSDIYPHNPAPAHRPDDPMPEVIVGISAHRLGATAILDDDRRVVGIITDGDLRRMIQRHPNFAHLRARDVMTPQPHTITANAPAQQAMQMFSRHKITQLPVVDADGRYVGMIHIHDLYREGFSG